VAWIPTEVLRVASPVLSQVSYLTIPDYMQSDIKKTPNWINAINAIIPAVFECRLGRSISSVTLNVEHGAVSLLTED